MKLTRLFNEFFDSEKAGGLILIFFTVLSLVIANYAWAKVAVRLRPGNIYFFF